MSLQVCESSHGSISAISQFMFSRESLKLGKSVNDVNVNETFGFNLNFNLGAKTNILKALIA